MKNIICFIVCTVSIVYGSSLYAQRVPVQITLDGTYGSGGKVEAVVGGQNSEITAFDITHSDRVTTVFGKVSTPTPGIYHIGMMRVDSTGGLVHSFGTGGIVEQSWGNASDYPIGVPSNIADADATYIVAGASSVASSDQLPSVYKFNRKSGTPDSSFGTNGKVIMPFADHSSGEAVAVYVSGGEYIVFGESKATDLSGTSGFGVMQFKSDGTLDSTFGVNGRNVMPALVHSVHGFFLNNSAIFICGICDTGNHELLIGLLTNKGMPDNGGVNGLIHTGVFLTGDTIFASLEGDNKIVMLLPTPHSLPTHLTIRRFDSKGIPDSTYGTNGIGPNDITPSYQPKGFFLSSDNGEAVCGMTNTEIGHSIYTRISDTTAHPDPIFNKTGIVEIDIDSGKYANYLKFVEPIGKLDQVGNIKRFIAIGGSIQNGVEHFMVARFIGHPFNGVNSNSPESEGLITVYPEPANSNFKIKTISDGIKNVRIVDALGREIMRLGSGISELDANTYSANASAIPNGIYYCIIQTASRSIVQKFTVTH